MTHLTESRFYDSDANLHVLYDGKIYDRQKAGGINRYFEKLIDHLPDSVTPSITLTRNTRQNFPTNSKLQRHVFDFSMPKPFRKLSRSIQAIYFESVRREIQPDLMHLTYYDSLSRHEKATDGIPLVLTVHDMIHERYPDLLDRRGRHAALKKNAIRRADAIICVSQKTQSDLLDLYPECESRSTVIHHATDFGKVTPDKWQPTPDRPYFLYVGSRVSYKNFDGLLQAFHQIVKRKPEIQLRVAGPDFRKHEEESIAVLGLENHVFNHGLVDDCRLSSMYRNSLAFIYPSLYEGFGLPLLEAMSCETPVIASNTSCIPEVVADAALLFDPGSKSDLVEAISFVIDNPGIRKQFIEDGKVRCNEFSWEKTAAQTSEVYRHTAGVNQAIQASGLKIFNPDAEPASQPQFNTSETFSSQQKRAA